MSAKTEAARYASENLASIERLVENPDFRRFMDGIKRQADYMADQILHAEELSPVEREAERQKRNGLMEVLRGPQLIIEGSQSIIRSDQ